MLKLYINEGAYIKEDIEAVKKYYPNIEDDMFMNLIALDPTYRDGSNSVGKYGKWILNLYNKGNLAEDDFEDVTPLLNQFTIYRNRIQNKDLNSYKSLSALEDVLASVIDDDSMLTDRQKLRFLKNVKAGRVKTDKDNDYDIVLNTPKFIVYVPNTHEASIMLGKGTRWCTAHENSTHFDRYTKNGGKLYIVQSKDSNKRWQYSDKEDEFLDDYNEEFNVLELLQQDEMLSKFFEKFLGYDAYNVPDVYVYDGNPIPEKLKPYIENVIISNAVTYIDDFTFKFFRDLRTVTILDGVESIGAGVFLGCRFLKRVDIPNSVTHIHRGAFVDCISLTSIIIPDSVNTLEDFIFKECSNLTVYTNNEYAINYCNKNNIPVKPLTRTESYKLHIKEGNYI